MIVGVVSQQRPLGRRGRPVRPVGARDDLHAVHAQRAANRCDPEPVSVFVDECTDHRRSGSSSPPRILRMTLTRRNSWRPGGFRRSSRSSRAVSLGRPAASPASHLGLTHPLPQRLRGHPNRDEIAHFADNSES